MRVWNNFSNGRNAARTPVRTKKEKKIVHTRTKSGRENVNVCLLPCLLLYIHYNTTAECVIARQNARH